MQPAVLIIDDDPVSVTMAEGVLRGEFGDSITLFTAASVTDGQRILLTHNIDCLILDLGLPGFSGGDVVSHFRELFNDVPIVVLTGEDAKRMELQVIARGAISFCNKIDCGALLPRLVVAAYQQRYSQTQLATDLYRRLDSLVTVLTQVGTRLDRTDADFRTFQRQVTKTVIGIISAVALALLGVVARKLFD